MKPDNSYPELAAHELEYIKSNPCFEYLYLRRKGRFEEADKLIPYFPESKRADAAIKAAFGEEVLLELKRDAAAKREL